VDTIGLAGREDNACKPPFGYAFRRSLAVPPLSSVNVYANVKLTGFTHRGLSPHKFTPLPGIHHDVHGTAKSALPITPEIREAWNNRLEVEWEHGTITLVSPEGLILLKSFRKSGQDQDDIDFLRSIINED
jgi:hypothetical protein